MSVSGVGATSNSYTYTTTNSTDEKSDMSGSDFMSLLLTQLSNQDPLEPMDNSQMISQMATLNMVSELQSISSQMDGLNKSSQSSYATSLIGKSVIYTDGEDFIKGTVTGTDMEDGQVTVLIDDVEVPVSQVVSVQGD